MEKIKISPYLRLRLDKLVDILHDKNYFSYKLGALKYVSDIYEFINTIPQQKRRPCEDPKYGFYYCKFAPNKNTTWYITFDTDDDIYLVKNIFNNHTKDYPDFIRNV